MRVHPFKIPKPDNQSLVYQEDESLVFYDKLHQHDEIQISFIEKGKGTLLVGDSIRSYQSSDLIVLGSNLPHAFKSDAQNGEISKMKSLFFTEVSFGNHFFDLDDFQELKMFFSASKQGFWVYQKDDSIKALFEELKTASKLERFILFLKIAKLIGQSELEPLSKFSPNNRYSDLEGKKMRNIFDFTIQNAHKKITLSDIANVANMTKNAFCKYFKKRTRKTYMNFLTELRIENACRLLVSEKEISISEIAYRCGFQNISNFNRRFKEIKKTTPLLYKKNNGLKRF